MRKRQERVPSTRNYRNLGAHTFPSPYRKEDAINFFTMNRKDGKNYFTMDFLIFAGDKLAGVIGLKDINYIDRNAHIGYWIGIYCIWKSL